MFCACFFYAIFSFGIILYIFYIIKYSWSDTLFSYISTSQTVYFSLWFLVSCFCLSFTLSWWWEPWWMYAGVCVFLSFKSNDSYLFACSTAELGHWIGNQWCHHHHLFLTLLPHLSPSIQFNISTLVGTDHSYPCHFLSSVASHPSAHHTDIITVSIFTKQTSILQTCIHLFIHPCVCYLIYWLKWIHHTCNNREQLESISRLAHLYHLQSCTLLYPP